MWGIVRNVTKTCMSLSLASYCLSTRSHQNLCTSYNTKGNECHAYIPPETGEDLGYKQSYCSFPPQKTPGVLFSNLGLWLLVTCSHHKLSCWCPRASTISSMGTRAALQHDQQKAGTQKTLGSPFQLSQRLNMWPSVTWSSYVKTKTEFKTRNTLTTRCFIWAKPFWVNILQRAQIISFQTSGICIYLNVYKILLFLDNRFIP